MIRTSLKISGMMGGLFVLMKLVISVSGRREHEMITMSMVPAVVAF